MLAKVESEERMDPPIQTEYFLSGGAMTLTFMVAEKVGLKSLISSALRELLRKDIYLA